MESLDQGLDNLVYKGYGLTIWFGARYACLMSALITGFLC